MKTKSILTIILFLTLKSLSAQTYAPQIQVGLGFGVNYRPSNVYDWTISPVGYKLIKDKINHSSFVVSSVLCFSPEFEYKKIADGTIFKAPGPFTLMVGLNLAEVSNTSNLKFNSRIGGGIGAGVNIRNTAHLGVMVDFMPYRILRKSYEQYENNQILIKGSDILTALDDSYFFTQFVPSYSIKLIFSLSKRKDDEASGVLSKPSGVELN